MTETLDALAAVAERLATAAAEVILPHYRATDLVARSKADDSPLTAADLAAHEVIVAGLAAATPQIPVLSEEGEHADPAERAGWRRCWLVDPLDGTREFLAANGEFTVNIALIESGRPVLGVVGVPARSELYVGVVPMRRAQRVDVATGARHDIAARRFDPSHPVLLASRSHRTPALEHLVAVLQGRFPGLTERAVGSALKLVELAAGVADGYPRRGPCCEWDIAAGEAVLLAAGGALERFDGGPLRYNKTDTLLNPDFWAVADPDGALAQALREMG